MKTILIGTNNPSKLALIRQDLAGLGVECVSPADLHLTDIPAETARSASENALLKAQAWHRASGLPVITEDSGLVFVDLPPDHPDQPGVFVRRVGGKTLTDEEMLRHYAACSARHGGALQAAWQDAWCVLIDENTIHLRADTADTLREHSFTLLDTPCERRVPGWPLDSLSYFPAAGKYKADMTREEVMTYYQQKAAGSPSGREMTREWLRRCVSEWAK